MRMRKRQAAQLALLLVCVVCVSGGFQNQIEAASGESFRTVIGENGSVVCNTQSEDIRWVFNGKNITKGSNKRFV